MTIFLFIKSSLNRLHGFDYRSLLRKLKMNFSSQLIPGEISGSDFAYGVVPRTEETEGKHILELRLEQIHQRDNFAVWFIRQKQNLII